MLFIGTNIILLLIIMSALFSFEMESAENSNRPNLVRNIINFNY